jgi:hypothetical protein
LTPQDNAEIIASLALLPHSAKTKKGQQRLPPFLPAIGRNQNFRLEKAQGKVYDPFHYIPTKHGSCMRAIFLIAYFLASTLLALERSGSFEDNHVQFVTQHLPNLLNHKSGKCLLMGISEVGYLRLYKQIPLIDFSRISLWNRNLWNNDKQDSLKERFDCIIAFNILEREPNRDLVVQMIFDLLKPEGKAVIYVDPQDESTFNYRTEQAIRHSEWVKHIPIVPSLSLSEYQRIIEKVGFQIVNQSPDEYKIYFLHDFSAFLSVMWFVCPRWPIPRTDWDEELFSGTIRDSLNCRHEITKVSNAPPIFSRWIEDNFLTHYFIVQK